MTTYLITAQKIDALYEFIEKDGYSNQWALDILKSLPKVDSEPVAWIHKDEPHFNGDKFVENYGVTTSEGVAKWRDSNARPLFTSPQALTPEDDDSDWFYKLQFICRVLEGNPPEQDKATALGMVRSLKRERWTIEKSLAPITAADVTDEMVNSLDGFDFINYAEPKALIAATVNAYLVIKHRSEAK